MVPEKFRVSENFGSDLEILFSYFLRLGFSNIFVFWQRVLIKTMINCLFN